MTIKEFINLIESYQKNLEEIDKICNIFPNFFELKPIEYIDELFDEILKAYFEEHAIDTIYWYLFEHNDKSKPGMWDEDGNVIPMETIEDLWHYVKNYLKDDII